MGAKSRVLPLLAILMSPAAIAAELRMDNAFLDVTIDPDNGRLTVKSKRLDQAAFAAANFCRKTKSAKAGDVSHATWGKGSEIQVVHEDGSRCSLCA
jgi:hypothetical protein